MEIAPKKPRKWPRWLRWLKWTAIVLVCWIVVIPSIQALWLRHQIATAFAASKSVRLEEFLPSDMIRPSRTGEVLTLMELNGEQRKALASAIPLSPAINIFNVPGFCYEPHHRIVMTNYDGGQIGLEICFGCGELIFDQGHVTSMPMLWPHTALA